MKKAEIKGEVEQEIKKWIDIHRLREQQISISHNALEFIVEVIDNIQEDPQRSWSDRQSDLSQYQRQAISLVPNALNDVMRGRGLRTFRRGELEISTWDIWLSLSDIIRNWCFIPRDV